MCVGWPVSLAAQSPVTVQFDFCGTAIQFEYDKNLEPTEKLRFTQESIQSYYLQTMQGAYQPAIDRLLAYKEQYKPDDWLFYQLIRQTAQQLSPKAEDYLRYTFVKWFLLTKTGYEAMLTVSGEHVLFYVRCDENIYNIPFRMHNGQQYVCLNYHDYGTIDFNKEKFTEAIVPEQQSDRVFSYKIRHLPDFRPTDYLEKDLQFTYCESDYHFRVKLNPKIKSMFVNYPVVDYESYLNIPLSRETYNSLIPSLKKSLKGLNTKSGVDYLMRFTRSAFMYETDTRVFGSEKRLSPEQTLLYDQSDCEDRVGLFFYLVKEIYNLPMIVLTYPKHVTIAVQLDKPAGKPIIYNGNKYYVCEPTPQKEDLKVGELLPELNNKMYEVAYVYNPVAK